MTPAKMPDKNNRIYDLKLSLIFIGGLLQIPIVHQKYSRKFKKT